MTIDSLLQSFQRFGVNLGLERIKNLLEILGNPQDQIPIIHVTGTNGKGSVCAYLSSILSTAGYKVGRYISPHLIDWTERISINGENIETATLENLLKDIESLIDPQQESPTQFEVITAAAWLYFAREKVDIAVMEVGLGGRLDATNVCAQPLVTVITSISREHWQNLGPTVADIAGEKAGILKANCAAVIGQLPESAQGVVRERIKLLNCPTVWVEAAEKIADNRAKYQGLEYPLSLAGDFQLTNSAIAIAVVNILRRQGWQISDEVVQEGMAKTRWLGRLQTVNWCQREILIDGAHNPAAAIGLRQYVDSLKAPKIIWVMGILSTKDHREIFQALLRKGDSLYLVPVPDHSSANPETLAKLADSICPELSHLETCSDVFLGLKKAIQESADSQIILCGSLYLVGYFLGSLLQGK
ncbi:bifunctional folylpolyglutamate synthase/dihydrofolate synthase [Microcystis aeruginosa]|uniref:bifunctional folylpolyglutamate synthase/dihydrofolate synthase n=1 Tax=Microcystis aeruginosa TaxID=1126 RepID=UPI00187EA450|nr:folylpolyglutamate synthase/dihydrofolate synthase family protein [Microcystis aeruginosa]MBE8995508.1 bifunctional folylpolyglutamate synthase/dihydrofolate synthase [Microcystis aeruginosa LEGE 91341]